MSVGCLKQQMSKQSPISHVSRCLWWPFLALPFPFARSARHSMPSDPTSFVSAAPPEDRPITAVDSFFSQLPRLAACGVACGKISHLSLDQCPAQSPRLPPSKLQPSLHRPQSLCPSDLKPIKRPTRNPLHPSSPHPIRTFFYSSPIHTKIIGCVLVSSVLCHLSRPDQLRGPLATNFHSRSLTSAPICTLHRAHLPRIITFPIQHVYLLLWRSWPAASSTSNPKPSLSCTVP